MDQRVPDIAEQLLLIERALRLHGLWSPQAPSAEALASTVPFALDSLRFEEWLQWIFLPRMKILLETDQALPNASGILAMAETLYAHQLDERRSLLEALGRFDQLIQGI